MHLVKTRQFRQILAIFYWLIYFNLLSYPYKEKSDRKIINVKLQLYLAFKITMVIFRFFLLINL